MKSFSTAYYNSRKEVKADKEALIEQEHAKLIAAIKREYGVNNFGTLNESEKASYRSLVNKLWSREKGLTFEGRKFINESVITLTPESTPEQIEKAFRREIKANLHNYISIISGNSTNWEDASKLKAKIEKEIGRKLLVKDCKKWIYTEVSAEIAKKINAIKF